MFAQNTSFQWTEESGKRYFCGFLSADSFTAVVQFTPGSLGYLSQGGTQRMSCGCKSGWVLAGQKACSNQNIHHTHPALLFLSEALIHTHVPHAWKDQPLRAPGGPRAFAEQLSLSKRLLSAQAYKPLLPSALGLSLDGSYYFGIHLCTATDFQKSHSSTHLSKWLKLAKMLSNAPDKCLYQGYFLVKAQRN